MTQHSSSPFQIDIPRRASQCTKCLNPFQKGEVYYSTILPAPGQEAMERRDYCANCASQLTKEKGHTYWKSALPPPKVESDLPKKRDDKALVLLKEAIKSNDPEVYQEAFVLALFLARRRVIYQRQEVKVGDHQDALIYEVAETEEMLCVPKVPLSELQLGKIQQELAHKLS